jgi:hypothetical protein
MKQEPDLHLVPGIDEDEDVAQVDPRDEIIRRLNAALSRPIDELLDDDAAAA